MNETLHTCPDCGQENFTLSGLKTHQGGKTCLKRAAQSSDDLTLVKDYEAAAEKEYGLTDAKPSKLEGEAAACVSRFRAFHETVKGNVLYMKLAKFLGGIEVQTLCDLHGEMYGETRGGDHKTDSLSVLLETFLEERLEVTARTARRYKNHFLSCTQEKPELAAKLVAWWKGWKESAALTLTQAAPAPTPTGKGKKSEALVNAAAAPSALALHEVCNLAANEVQELLDHADAWGLHELFEKPLKDVTPPAETGEDDTGPGLDAKERLAKFWLKDFCRRALNNEFLKLRRQEKEALLITFEEATLKLKSSLEGKGARKA